METSQLVILGGFLALGGLVFLRLVAIGRHSVMLRLQAEAAEKALSEARRRILDEATQAAAVRDSSDVELVEPPQHRG